MSTVASSALRRISRWRFGARTLVVAMAGDDADGVEDRDRESDSLGVLSLSTFKPTGCVVHVNVCVWLAGKGGQSG